MGRQSAGTRWYENASLCVVIIVRQKQMLQYLSVSVMVIRDLKTAQRSHCSLFSGQASNSPASFHAPSGVQGATRPTRSSGGVMGAKVGWAWDLRISALQCSNIPAFSLRAQVGRGIVAAPWLSTFVMSECACSCTRSHTTPELAPTKV